MGGDDCTREGRSRVASTSLTLLNLSAVSRPAFERAATMPKRSSYGRASKMQECLNYTNRVRRVGSRDSGSIEEEPNASGGLSLAVAEGIHQLFELSGPLDLEENLIVTIGNLDVEVFRLGFGLGGSIGLGIRHGGCVWSCVFGFRGWRCWWWGKLLVRSGL